MRVETRGWEDRIHQGTYLRKILLAAAVVLAVGPVQGSASAALGIH